MGSPGGFEGTEVARAWVPRDMAVQDVVVDRVVAIARG